MQMRQVSRLPNCAKLAYIPRCMALLTLRSGIRYAAVGGRAVIAMHAYSRESLELAFECLGVLNGYFSQLAKLLL